MIVQAIINFILHYIADLDIPIKRLAYKFLIISDICLFDLLLQVEIMISFLIC